MSGSSLISRMERGTYGPTPIYHLPLISSPAVMKSNPYEVDDLEVLTRGITSAALSAIGLVGLYFLCPPAALLMVEYDAATLSAWFSLTACLTIYEHFRANYAANEKAVHNYAKKEYPSKQALDRIACNPRAFQMLLDEKLPLNKMATKARHLYQRIFNPLWPLPKVQDMFLEKSGELLSIPDLSIPDLKSFFMSLIETNFIYSYQLTPVLEKFLTSQDKRVQEVLEELKKDSCNLLKKTNSPLVLSLLCQHGFSLDAKDENGETLLMHWGTKLADPSRYSESMCIKILNLGANPLLTNAKGQKASDLFSELNPNPIDTTLLEILLQAEAEANADPVKLPEEKEGWLASLLGKPFVIQGEHRVDDKAIWIRVGLVAIACMAPIYISLPLTPGVISFAAADLLMNISCAGMIASLFWGLALFLRGALATDGLAVSAYLKDRVPSEDTSFAISRSQAAAKMLVELLPQNSPLLNRRHRGIGKSTLLGQTTDPEIFKLLVEKGADIHAGGGLSGFMNAVGRSTTDLLEYLKEKKLLPTPENIQLQAMIWDNVQTKETAEFFKQRGFDPNTADEKGKTPLQRLVIWGRLIGGVPRACFLISIGADPTDILKEISDPNVRSILEEAYKEVKK